MFDSISNLFSSKQESSQETAWSSTTATIQSQQPSSPDAPTTDRVVTEQPVWLQILRKHNPSEIH